MHAPEHSFLKVAGRVLNARQARTLILTGNINDLFFLPDERCQKGQLPEGRPDGAGSGEYVPLIDFITANWDMPGRILLVYELNGPIRFLHPEHKNVVRDAWLHWRTGYDRDELAIKDMLSGGRIRPDLDILKNSFDENLESAIGRPTIALEFLRQLCLCSRSAVNGTSVLPGSLIVLIEAADMVLPDAPITHLHDADRHRVSICRDWFSDPGYMNGDDAVILLAESRSQINQRIASLPQVTEIAIAAPDLTTRRHCIEWFDHRLASDERLHAESTTEELARLTAGLSIHALLQLLRGAAHENRPLTSDDVIAKVEEFIQSQLGEDIVEFKKPHHTLDDVIGFTSLKTFLREELIPRFRTSGPEALPGAAVAGPIGGGKTFMFEAVASELDMVVLVLKNIRSQWFGQTDVIFERLRRVLDALAKVLIFVDEADTQFGGVGSGTHETERRLTGKIQAMMSDPRLRGRVVWLLMTARIHLLSPDIRRPGRVGDLIIPILDPTGDDRRAFLRWALGSSLEEDPDERVLASLDEAFQATSAAAFASLRSELKARVILKGQKLTLEETLALLADRVPPAIGETRRYQTLQALINCTRRSLLPDPQITEAERSDWQAEIRLLESKGIR